MVRNQCKQVYCILLYCDRLNVGWEELEPFWSGIHEGSEVKTTHRAVAHTLTSLYGCGRARISKYWGWRKELDVLPCYISLLIWWTKKKGNETCGSWARRVGAMQNGMATANEMDNVKHEDCQKIEPDGKSEKYAWNNYVRANNEGNRKPGASENHYKPG